MKTAKIKQVRENAYKGYETKTPPIKTMYVHGITLETPIDVDGTQVSEFKYHSATPQCTKFKAGEEATFTVEKEKFGSDYKIAPLYQPGAPKAGAKKEWKSDKDNGLICGESVLSSMATFYQGRSDMTIDKLIVAADKAYDWVKTKKGDIQI